MKIKIIAVVALILAGLFTTVALVGRQTAEKEEYIGYLTLARSNAERDIPYVAVQNYRRAINMDSNEETIYKEYLVQAQKLGIDFYTIAVKEYVEYFPNSSEAYETLCKYYYDHGNYKMVLETALEAKSKEIATEQVKNYYLECSAKYRIIAGGFSEVTRFWGNSARVKVGELFGYVSRDGYYTIFPVYEAASFFLGANTAALVDGQWCMINGSGYVVARPDRAVDSLSFLNNGRILFSLNGKYDYMTTSLIVPEEIRFDDATNFKNGVAAVQKDGKWALMNSDMEMITDYIYEDVQRDEFNTCINNDVIFVKQNGKYHMVNSEAQPICEMVFDDVYPFVSSEPAAVCISGKWGFIDGSGNMIIDPQYENAKSFDIGLGAVCQDGLWGYININNEVRIDFQYEDCIPFSDNGVTAIFENESWTYIKLLPYID